MLYNKSSGLLWVNFLKNIKFWKFFLLFSYCWVIYNLHWLSGIILPKPYKLNFLIIYQFAKKCSIFNILEIQLIWEFCKAFDNVKVFISQKVLKIEHFFFLLLIDNWKYIIQLQLWNNLGVTQFVKTQLVAIPANAIQDTAILYLEKVVLI